MRRSLRIIRIDMQVCAMIVSIKNIDKEYERTRFIWIF